MSNGQDEWRADVAQAYTSALERSREAGGGCCGATGAAERARYGEAAERYRAAARSSFGCGNPLALAGVARGERVLDLGSGAGLDLLVAAEKVGPEGRVIGIDMTPAMVDAARRAAERAGHDHVEVRQGLIEELPVESASVDWVISNCVINLSPDKPRVFAEIARVLRPGGRFSIADIVVDELPEWIRRSAAARAACVGGAISERDYLAGLRRAGLADVAVAERMTYDAAQLRALVDADGALVGLPPELVDAALSAVAGRVASDRFTGRRP